MEAVPLDQFLHVLEIAEWQQRLVEVARIEPRSDPDESLTRLVRARDSAWTFEREQHTEIDRATAERYLAVLLRFELAYRSERLPADSARFAAALFIHLFGPDAQFFTSITLTAEVLAAKETRGPCSYGGTIGPLGSTMEEGLYVFDPAGLVGAVVIGDED